VWGENKRKIKNDPGFTCQPFYTRPAKPLSTLSLASNPCSWGRFFVHFIPGKIPGKISGKIPRKIFPKKCWEKMEFSAEKVLKNRFSKKFRGIFRGKSLSAEKNVRKIGP
jgi:hypothetical protein